MPPDLWIVWYRGYDRALPWLTSYLAKLWLVEYLVLHWMDGRWDDPESTLL